MNLKKLYNITNWVGPLMTIIGIIDGLRRGVSDMQSSSIAILGVFITIIGLIINHFLTKSKELKDGLIIRKLNRDIKEAHDRPSRWG